MVAHAGMLRVSIEHTDLPIEYRAITDRTLDPRLPGGSVLLDLVDAVLLGREEAVEPARQAVIAELGWEATVDAAGVIGNFQMMNRIADASGMPVGTGRRRASADLIDALGLASFDHVDAD